MYLTQGLHRARLKDVIVTNGHNVYSTEVELSPIGKPLKHKLREPYWSGTDRQVS